MDRARSLVYGDETRQRASQKVLDLRAQGKGWMESSADAISSLRKERKNEQFSEHLAKLLDYPTVNFDILKEQIEQIVNAKDSMTAMQRMQLQFDSVRGGGQAEALEGMIREYKDQLKVIEAMTPSERCKPLMLLKREAIARIVAQLGLADDKPVRAVLRMYRGMQVQHELVHREVKARRPLPTNQDDVDRLIKLYPTRSSVAFMKAEHWKELKKQKNKR